jgi:hypothetical protein
MLHGRSPNGCVFAVGRKQAGIREAERGLGLYPTQCRDQLFQEQRYAVQELLRGGGMFAQSHFGAATRDQFAAIVLEEIV